MLPLPSSLFAVCGLFATQGVPIRAVELILGTVFLVLFCIFNGTVFKKAIFAALFAPLCLVFLTLIASVWLRMRG